ncbi:MAG: hypothetical protein ABI333_01365 [bacterium]
MKSVSSCLAAALGVAVLVTAPAGCKQKGRSGGEPASEPGAPPDRAGKTTNAEPPERRPVVDEQAQRRERVKRELERYRAHTLVFDASELSPQDNKLCRALLRAVAIVEELNKLQIHPNNLLYEKAIAVRGTPLDKQLYQRYQMPWCTDDEHRLCNAHPALVPKRLGLHHWPPGMNDAELAALSKAPNSKELLSNFTMVRRLGRSAWKAVPYAADPLLGPPMRRLAKVLREAAGFAAEPTLKKFLLSRADALEAKTPFPYDASDYDWIALKGKWEVNVGPYETYKNPRQLKARFKMVFGLEDPEITARLARFKKSLQQMENSLATLVGRKIYKPRKLDPRIAIRAIQVISSGGDARAPHGATVAFHLPNRGKSVDEGLYKKVMLVNHSTAFKTIMKRRAALILAPSQQRYVSTTADITNTTFHEFAHGFGAHDELKIRTADGQVTVHQALKEHTTLMEELKADVTSMWLIGQSVKRGWLKPEEAKTRYVSGLMHILGLSSYPLKGTYPRMVAVQLGWYVDHGGVVWKDGRFEVDFTKLPRAVESLTKRVAAIQLTGDYAAAVKLIARYVKPVVKGKQYEYVGKIKVPLTTMKAAFKKADIKSVALSYKVIGL